MNKTLILAATLLSFGVGSAFAGDGDVNAQAAQLRNAPIAAHMSGQNRLFPASSHAQTNVYGLFGNGGFAQGGEN